MQMYLLGYLMTLSPTPDIPYYLFGGSYTESWYTQPLHFISSSQFYGCLEYSFCPLAQFETNPINSRRPPPNQTRLAVEGGDGNPVHLAHGRMLMPRLLEIVIQLHGVEGGMEQVTAVGHDDP